MASVTQPAERTAGRYHGASGLPLAGKISLVLLFVVSLAALAVARLGQEIVYRHFGATESELVLRNRHVLLQAIQSDLDYVDTISLDWSQWNELHDYAMGTNPAFDGQEVNPEALERLQLDVIQFLDPGGRLVRQEVRAGLGSNTARSPPDIGAEIRAAVTAKPGRGTAAVSGWLDTSIGPMVLAAQPILRSDASGPVAGTLIMARSLDPAALSAALSVLPSTVIVHASGSDSMTPEQHALFRRLKNMPDASSLVLRDDDMSQFRYFEDINGKPAFVLETVMARSILATGRETSYQLSIVLLGFVVLVFILLVAIIRFTASRPLGQLATHMALLRETGQFQPMPGTESGDEIGTLARSFNELVIARQKIEGELRTLSTVAEHTDESIVIIGVNGSIEWVNPAFERSRQLSCEDLTGRRPDEVIKGCDDPAMYRDIWLMVQSGKTWRGRMRTEIADRQVITEDVVVSPVREDGAKEPSAYVMLMHDVTGRIAMESQLEQAHRLEAVGQLASGVAHEINTPAQYVDGNIRFFDEAFNTLSGVLEKISAQVRASADGRLSAADIASLLADAEVEYLQAEVPVAIRQTLEGIERIGSIVQSMKELTDPVPDFVPANLNPVIESAVNAARNEWADIAGFDMQLDPQLPWVQCQPESINQVVVCMLANAAQAIAEADEGRKARGHIVVRTRSAASRVEISISDDGIGMTPAVQARIFDPFFSTRPVGKGTGQSLGIAHSVIRRHGGTIAVDSTPGRGSCFRISLPLADGQRSSGGHQDPQLLRNTDRLAG
jgi:PAS domain S-box-containing protein